MQLHSTFNIKELRQWAKNNLITQTVYHEELGQSIRFTNKGIKEYLNQPHKCFQEKNELIKNILNVLAQSKYMGLTYSKSRFSHIFEIEIRGNKNWLIANEYAGSGIIFYSITESDKVLTDIKKPSNRLSKLQSDSF